MTVIDVKPSASLSDDVQDILRLAQKLARKQKASMGDRHVLFALLKQTRLFSYQDALLKNAGTSAQKLLGWYSLEAPQYANANAPFTALESTSGKIETEHLLLALCQSPDPLVQAVFKQANLTSNSILQSAKITQDKNVPRLVLYALREMIEVVVVVLFLVIVIKQGIGEFRLIPSESMVPTLQVGDRIVVEKVTHWLGRKPHRGDVLVFYPPVPEAILKHDPWSEFLRLTGFSGILYGKDSRIDIAFIKRVIGLPGDTVDVRPGRGVYVNGQKLNEPYVNEIANTCTFIYQCGPTQVPPHSYYMMGDNRNHSADSRYWGYMAEDHIIGRAVFRFFPIDSRFGVLKAPDYK